VILLYAGTQPHRKMIAAATHSTLVRLADRRESRHCLEIAEYGAPVAWHAEPWELHCRCCAAVL